MSTTSTSSTAMPLSSNVNLRRLLAAVVPQMTSSSHKGQNGRLCVIGGSSAYTGAPYFSSLTTLKLGADLCTVLTSVDAAIPIKTHSPELMVRPTLIPHHLLTVDGAHPLCGPVKGQDAQAVADAIEASVKKDVLERSNAVIVGPGLGKDDDFVTHTVAQLLTACRALHVPLVLDGDGIAVAVAHPHTVHGNAQLIVTPNAAEFARLWAAFLPATPPPPMSLPVDAALQAFMHEHAAADGGVLDADHAFATHASQLARAMGGVTVLRKGAIDVASDGRTAVYCCRRGAPRRCGGQGDVLTGAIGTVWAWCGIKRRREAEERKKNGGRQPETDDVVSTDGGEELREELLAAFSGSLLVRMSAEVAFKAHGRSMLASHVMDGMEDVIEELFPVRSKI